MDPDMCSFLTEYYPSVALALHASRCRVVNTKNWYKEETDLWAEIGGRAPFGKRFSSKHSVKASVVGNTPSFGRRAVSRLEEEAFRNV
jgi:hypothetical protein